MTRKHLAAVALAGAVSLAGPDAEAGGSVSLSVHGHDGRHHSAAAIGLILYGLIQGPTVPNRATVRQSGRGNSAVIRQSGGGNRAVIHQDGRGHRATIHQHGYGHHSRVYQFGHGTSARLGNHGYGHGTMVIQYGW